MAGKRRRSSLDANIDYQKAMNNALKQPTPKEIFMTGKLQTFVLVNFPLKSLILLMNNLIG